MNTNIHNCVKILFEFYVQGLSQGGYGIIYALDNILKIVFALDFRHKEKNKMWCKTQIESKKDYISLKIYETFIPLFLFSLNKYLITLCLTVFADLVSLRSISFEFQFWKHGGWKAF